MLLSFRETYEDYITHISPADMALSWEALTAISEMLIERQPRRIIEYGSGISTCLIAEYCRATGAEAESFDSDAEWAERTRGFLDKNQLVSKVSVSFLESVQPVAPADLVLWDFDRNPKRVMMMVTAFHNVASGGIIYIDDMQNHEIASAAAMLSGSVVYVTSPDGFGRFGVFLQNFGC